MKSTIRKQMLSIVLLSTVMAMLSCSGGKNKVQIIDPTVQTLNGLVKGVINENNTVVSFKSIPYAAPPVGDLRWREPEPPVSWEGVREASNFSPSAIQNRDYSREPWTSEFMVQDSISEDCLYLNVWTSAKTAEDKLPVLVFLHGGGLVEGSGAIAVYDGEELSKKGIIVITINYRLGVIGFLAHPELTAESPNHSSGNYGYFDQIAALKWVNKNIAAFGGDPSRVTISGQSAGAGSVRALIVSPLAAGLFHRAITESGSSYTSGVLGATRTLQEAENQGIEFAKSKGASTIAELRAMPATELIAVNPDQPSVRFGGSIDGYFQVKEGKTVFDEGKQNDTPFMSGMNAGETRYSGDNGEPYKKLYPSGTEEEAAANLKLAGQEQSRLNTYLWMEFRAKTSKTNSYEYFFDHAIPWPERPEFGAFHTSEVPYVFNNMKKIVNHTMTDQDSVIADIISSYWVNFIKTGDPNGPGLAEWAPYNSEKHEVMRIGDGFGMIPIASSEEKYDFLKDQLLKQTVQAR